jgi:hypothetical protein
MQFSPQAFNNFLGSNGSIGQNYRWFKSDACPCISKASGASNPACPLCHGKGRQYSAGVDGVAGMSGAKTQREWAQFGVWERGDIVVTIPENSPLYDLGQYDRVTALNSTLRFSEVLRRGSGMKERLTFAVEAITRVFWLTPDGAGVVEGAVPTVAADGSLSWPDGATLPPSGAAYTVTGTKYLDYFCFGDFPSNRNMNQGSRLPRKVILRDFDLFSR